MPVGGIELGMCVTKRLRSNKARNSRIRMRDHCVFIKTGFSSSDPFFLHYTPPRAPFSAGVGERGNARLCDLMSLLSLGGRECVFCELWRRNTREIEFYEPRGGCISTRCRFCAAWLSLPFFFFFLPKWFFEKVVVAAVFKMLHGLCIVDGIFSRWLMLRAL